MYAYSPWNIFMRLASPYNMLKNRMHMQLEYFLCCVGVCPLQLHGSSINGKSTVLDTHQRFKGKLNALVTYIHSFNSISTISYIYIYIYLLCVYCSSNLQDQKPQLANHRERRVRNPFAILGHAGKEFSLTVSSVAETSNPIHFNII